MQVYVHRLRKYVGSYAFGARRFDAIAFTAGIGENVPEVRERAFSSVSRASTVWTPPATPSAPRASGSFADDSPVTVLIVLTDEYSRSRSRRWRSRARSAEQVERAARSTRRSIAAEHALRAMRRRATGLTRTMPLSSSATSSPGRRATVSRAAGYPVLRIHAS